MIQNRRKPHRYVENFKLHLEVLTKSKQTGSPGKNGHAQDLMTSSFPQAYKKL